MYTGNRQVIILYKNYTVDFRTYYVNVLRSWDPLVISLSVLVMTYKQKSVGDSA